MQYEVDECAHASKCTSLDVCQHTSLFSCSLCKQPHTASGFTNKCALHMISNYAGRKNSVFLALPVDRAVIQNDLFLCPSDCSFILTLTYNLYSKGGQDHYSNHAQHGGGRHSGGPHRYHGLGALKGDRHQPAPQATLRSWLPGVCVCTYLLFMCKSISVVLQKSFYKPLWLGAVIPLFLYMYNPQRAASVRSTIICVLNCFPNRANVPSPFCALRLKPVSQIH